MRTTPITLHFGAEVFDVDLARADAAELAELCDLLRDNGVLAVRDQRFDLGSFEAFAGQLAAIGPVTQSPFVEPMDGRPNVLLVAREADEDAPAFGAGWHSDWSFQDAPPAATLLYGVDVPASGGDTAFGDMHMAYDALSPAMAELLCGLRAEHSARRFFAPSGVYDGEKPNTSMSIHPSERAYDTKSHPMVREHTLTGRRSLLANECYTIGIEGMSDAEARPLLDFIYDHVSSVAFGLRLRWQPGTLLIWDNQAVQHRAIDDYFGQRREMWRMVLGGVPPIPAASSPATSSPATSSPARDSAATAAAR